jgi:hypothetical protein
MPYILVRQLPDGEITSHTGAFATLDMAGRAMGLCLYDNRQETRTRAQRLGVRLIRQPLGTLYEHEHGYKFRILRAEFTSDRVAITPGLRVVDNNLVRGTVDPAQFMRTGDLDPGGEHFLQAGIGWYDVIRGNGDTKKFDGSRLTTREI